MGQVPAGGEGLAKYGDQAVRATHASQISAVEYACKITNRWLRDGEIFIPILRDEITSIEKLFKPIIGTIEPSAFSFTQTTMILGYEVDEKDIPTLEKSLATNKEAAGIITDKLFQHVMSGHPMSWQLKGLLLKINQGGFYTLKDRGGRRSVSDRTVLFCGLVDQIKERFGVTASCNKVLLGADSCPPPDTGVSIVSAVFRAFGLNFETSTGFGLYDKGSAARRIARENKIILLKINEMSDIQDRLNVVSSEMSGRDQKAIAKACTDLRLHRNNLP